MKRRWQLWLGLAVSAVTMGLAIRGIDLPATRQAFAQARYLYLIPATIGLLLYLLSRAVRWRLLLGPQVSLARSFWVTCIGYLVSNVYPFRLGDPARAVVMGQGEIPTSAALSTVVVERVLDMVMVVGILAAVAPFVGGAGAAVRAGILAGILALAAIALLVTLAFRPQWGRRAVRRALGLIPRLDGERWAAALDGLFTGLAPLRSGRQGAALLAWSAITWAWVVFFYWALLHAFLSTVPPLAPPFLVCILGLGLAVPSSPGAVGVFHLVAREGLVVPFGVPVEEAIPAAFAIHAFQYILMCILGLIGLVREGVSLGWLRTQAAQVEEK